MSGGNAWIGHLMGCLRIVASSIMKKKDISAASGSSRKDSCFQAMYSSLQRKGMAKRRKRIGDEPAALTGEEVDFLKELGGKAQTVEMSEGIIEQSVIKVYSGPLVGKEKYIRKIDRHKRRAMLEMPMFGEMRKMQVGLEIVAKS